MKNQISIFGLKAIRFGIISIYFSVLFVFIYFSFGNLLLKKTDAYVRATDYLTRNQEINKFVGGVTGFGLIPIGEVELKQGVGKATFHILVKGKDQNVEFKTQLSKKRNRDWEVIGLRN